MTDSIPSCVLLLIRSVNGSAQLVKGTSELTKLSA